MKFVDCLLDDIRSAVQMQCPTSVGTAVVLALLQEELVDPSRCRDGRRSEGRPGRKTHNSLARLTRLLMSWLGLDLFKFLINKPARYSSVS